MDQHDIKFLRDRLNGIESSVSDLKFYIYMLFFGLVLVLLLLHM